MDPRQDSRRKEAEARSAADELAVTLWCAAVLLMVLLLVQWGLREIYST